MSALHPDLRCRLEKDVIRARQLAEKGSAAAIARLGIGEAKVLTHLSDDEKTLRVALRARSRQLGDAKGADGSQETRHLMLEGAYEHWHQLLFTRFLAENNLLVMADGTPVTLEDCDDPEILRMENAPDGTALAMRYASRLLPQIFRPDDPLLRITFAPEHLQPLRKLVAELPAAIFQADDSLGWVYQFWRAEEKAAVNKAGDKIDADTLPAVTQLFTEHYMVEFLLHNTLGAWWTAKVEAAGRTSAIPLPYLRRKADGSPAAGAFPGWPKNVRELRVLDPCCGSGHFLVALLQLLVAMLKEEREFEGDKIERVEDPVRVVLGEILHGLEIDARCTQLAAFNVAFAAWRLIGRPVELPPLHIASSGLSVGATREEWLAAIGDNDKFLIGQLYDLFKKAPELGSLINPARLSYIGRKASDLLPAVGGLLAADPLANPERHELGITAKGLAEAAEILGGEFHLTVTNVPYLGSGKQDDDLKDFCATRYPDSRADLATCFVERGIEFCAPGGSCALVTPQNWLFLGTYKKLRQRLLEAIEWNVVSRLGAKAFRTPMWDFNIVLIALSRSSPSESQLFFGIDVGDEVTPVAKEAALRSKDPILVRQAGQSKNPDSRIGLTEPSSLPLLRTRATCVAGVLNGDSPRFIRSFWEVARFGADWTGLQSTVDSTQYYGGRELIIHWEDGNGQLRRLAQALRERLHDADKRGNQVWGKWGVAVSQMGRMPLTLYSGEKFDSNVAVISPGRAEDLPAIWAFASSSDFQAAVRAADQKLNVTNATLAKVPFDLTHWQRVAAEKYPKGLPKPHSDDPTQWLFNGHPRNSDHPLQVAVARVLDYRWPRQTGSEFPDCPALGPDGLEAFADGDGIVCLPPLRGERPASQRLQQLLAAAYGEENGTSAWSPAVLDHLLAEAGYGGKTLDDWLRDGFFDQHCQLFHQRPFIWHIWDGQKRGFCALMNYHRLDYAALTRLIFSYLGDWISDRKRDVEAGKSGSDALHLAARQLQDKLKLILEGESPYDIFVRWKPLEKQPIGWHPDLNDGVRLNIRPFIAAGVLRKTPKIKWGVDRGKNPSGAPWGEVRDNDRHLSLAEKRATEKG